MVIKGFKDFDVVNYKKPSLFIIFPNCSFKCDKENGSQYCQNWELVKQKNITIDTLDFIEKYYNPNLVDSVVLGGLEPFDSWNDLYEFIYTFRLQCEHDNDIVIYTGYNEDEIKNQLYCLSRFKNIIIKFGRYRPNQSPHYDEVLGVQLVSDNQYAKYI